MARRTGRRVWWKLLVCVAIGVLAVFIAPSPNAPVPGLTDPLPELDGHALAAYLDTHPGVTEVMLASSPQAVAEAWKRLPASTRHTLARSQPKLFGIMNGVDYASRDTANRIVLAQQLALAKRSVRTHPTTDAKQNLQALAAIDSTLHAHTAPHRYLIDLTTDSPPLAEIALGDLDRASQVTYVIPGMGTYTTDMQLWTQGAQNVWVGQGRAGAAKDRAVVSWIGYVTPPPGVAAAVGDYASQGAPRLVEDLEGLNAVRAHSRPTVSIIAHSYGTTMSADALSSRDLGVWSYVMLGSAGIEERIGTAARLHVPHVYAGEAKDDKEARFGRITRIDPRSPGFGATVIAVDGDPARDLEPVTGHDPVLHSAWNDDPLSSAWDGLDGKNADATADKLIQHIQSFGYLDAGTESLYNAAIATTPQATLPLAH
jgi:hypothetical protein